MAKEKSNRKDTKKLYPLHDLSYDYEQTFLTLEVLEKLEKLEKDKKDKTDTRKD